MGRFAKAFAQSCWTSLFHRQPATAAAKRDGSLPAKATLAPFRANAAAAARPMPEVAPVIKTTLSLASYGIKDFVSSTA